MATPLSNPAAAVRGGDAPLGKMEGEGEKYFSRLFFNTLLMSQFGVVQKPSGHEPQAAAAL